MSVAVPPLLDVEHLSMRFGGLIAIDDLSFAAARAEITAIIGPNGAGKTTVFNCITGFYKPTSGRLLLALGDADTGEVAALTSSWSACPTMRSWRGPASHAHSRTSASFPA
jgi:branched-chain amino acid transport system ATP-binding protein